MSTGARTADSPSNGSRRVGSMPACHVTDLQEASPLDRLDPDSVLQLRLFFELLDRWDEEAHEHEAV